MEILENEDELTIEHDSNGLIKLPKELEQAPEEVKGFYIKWLEAEKMNESDQRRYFSYVSESTNEVVQVDAMGFQGKVLRVAKEKGISNSDLKRLTALCHEMTAMKIYKTQCKNAWRKWLTPRIGKTMMDWHRAELIEMYSKYATHDEVKKWLEDQSYHVQMTSVLKFFLNNKDIIDKKRIEFIKTSKDHYLATDAGRMETLAMLHAKFINLFNDSYTKPRKDVAMLKALSQEIRAIIDQARKEIKGDEIRLTIDGKIDINASMQASITIQEISRKVPINIIPVFLVAAKRGMNPMNIVASLVNSFYREFNGFGKLTQSNVVPHTMDLIRNYDWTEIANYHASKPIEEEVPMSLYEEVPFVDVPKIQTKREKLEALIKQQREAGHQE